MIYSLCPPDVECVGGDKAHRRYEFGFKVAVAPAVAAHMCMKAAAAPVLRRILAKQGTDERPQNDRSPATAHYFLARSHILMIVKSELC